MDIASIIAIVIAIVVIYFLLKFIVSPIAKAILGVITFLIIISLMKRFLGFDFNRILSPFGISLNLDWILSPINYFINQAISIFNFMWQSVPKK